MAIRRIVLVYTNNPASKKHQVVAKVQEGNKTIKTRTFSIGRDRNERLAYEEAAAAAKVLAKKHNAELGVIPSMEELIASASRNSPGARKSSARNQPKRNPLVEMWNNLTHFKTIVTNGIRTQGADKMADIFTTGLEIVKEAQEEETRQQKIIYDAKELLDKEQLLQRIKQVTESKGIRKKTKSFEILEVDGNYTIDTLACKGLSPGEAKVLLLISRGLNYGECAQALGKSKSAVINTARALVLRFLGSNANGNPEGTMSKVVTEAFRCGTLFLTDRSVYVEK